MGGVRPGVRTHGLDVAAAASRALVRCRPAGARSPEVRLFMPLLRDAGLLD